VSLREGGAGEALMEKSAILQKGDCASQKPMTINDLLILLEFLLCWRRGSLPSEADPLKNQQNMAFTKRLAEVCDHRCVPPSWPSRP
jgi:hypothetical protein